MKKRKEVVQDSNALILPTKKTKKRKEVEQVGIV
jgi:hypothetical protein